MDKRFIGFIGAACFALAVSQLAMPSPAGATSYPGFMPMVTDSSQVFSIPSVPKPSYLVPATDPTFGTPIMRISNDGGASLTTATGSGTWGADARHHYSKDQPWNSDGTLIAIQNGGSPSQLLLDGETYQVKYGKCSNYSLGDERWHPSPLHPHEQINVNGSQLMWFDVVNCVKTRSWTLPFAVSYFGMSEGNPSADGRYVALSDGSRMFVVDMDPQPPLAPYPSERIGPTYTIPACGLSGGCTIDWVSISASGKYVVVSYDGDHPRVFDVDPTTLALSPRPMPSSSPRCSGGDPAQGYVYDVGHADLTMNPFDNNEDVLIGQEHCGNRGSTVQGQPMGSVTMVRLKDGVVTSLTNPTNEAYAHHISTRNYDRPGWAYVGYYPDAGKKYADEIVAVKLDGSKTVQRFADKHSAFSGCYRCESHAVPSRDGRRVIWASNWAEDCTTCGPSSEIKDYVVDARAHATTDSIPPAPRADLRIK
jgi:hypothetical protein